jgi:hypothetical protein
LWTCRSLRNLAKALADKGHKVSPTLVGNLLREIGYSLQANRKTKEGTQHIDRDSQFRYINEQAKAFLRAGQPVISVDTKKKDLVGISATMAGNGAHRASPKMSKFTTSSIPS